MKKYEVELQMIVGYYDEECDSPKLRSDYYKVEAINEAEAIQKAKSLDQTQLSVWDVFAEEIED